MLPAGSKGGQVKEKRKRVLFFILGIGGICSLTGCGENNKLSLADPVEINFNEVSVHDPAIVKGEDGKYDIFGSHLAVAETKDLINWVQVNAGVKNNNPVIPDVFTEMREAFEWAQTSTFWAPDVIRLQDGKYHMYYCNCQGSKPLSALGMAVSDNVAGPYKNLGILLKSGMDSKEPDEDGNLYQAAIDPNTVDPNVFYDKDGRLWMVYGSYSGGIFSKEMDAVTGLPLESGYGKKLLGGNHLRIEAPYILYNKDTDYYYLFLSFGGLDSDGGYNIRVSRSKNPDGPYTDSMGQDMVDCKGPDNTTFSDITAMKYGTKLMGNYKFLWKEGEEGGERKGYLSPGHNSCLYQEETGKYFIIYHTRFENSGERHQVRVHQMFFNKDGWPVITPYRYTGERIGAYTEKSVAGEYKFINHGRSISAEMKESVLINLKSNGKITGEVTGNWEFSGDNTITLHMEDKNYEGVVCMQYDDDGKKYVMTFTALCQETGEAVWGSGLKAFGSLK